MAPPHPNHWLIGSGEQQTVEETDQHYFVLTFWLYYVSAPVAVYKLFDVFSSINI